VAVILVALGAISWLVTRWRVEGSDLRIETGVLRRSSLRFPLAQVQAIDIVRPLVARIFGLSELRLRMGGATGHSGRLAYLTEGHADTVRAQLLAIGHGVTAETDESPERVLISVPVGRLIGSIVIGPAAIFLVVALTALIITAVLSPEAAVAIVGSSGAIGLGLVGFLWRRLNSGFNLTVAQAPDGLRVRSGLLDTTAETIPSGRVQAVRMIEPLLWRPLGWCRLEVDVAGRQRSGGENRGQSRELRAALPVGTRSEAAWLLGRLISDAPQGRVPAPLRARYKAPLRYHFLSWGKSDTCVVATSGRVTRVTSWVPLGKVQSLRRVQGPLQRRLGLASVHLDTAGRRVGASLLDRDATEADQAIAELTALSRAARRSAPR